MSEVTGSKSWREELMSLVDDTGIRYSTGDAIGFSSPVFETKRSHFGEVEGESESFKDQVKGFAKAWGEIVFELGKGYRDPVHSWSVIFFVFLLAFAVLNVNNKHDSWVSPVKKVYIHPPSATRILLPDGRQMAYREQGVPSDRARYSLIAPHGFLSSRLAATSSKRNLNSSALDMIHLANAVGLHEKFWVLGFSSGAMHAWAALKFIPDRIAGAAMFAPMVNPCESSMTKEEMSRTWEKWVRRRKLMYYLARRFPKFLSYFYGRSFLSGKHGQIEKWLSLSLGKKDKALTEGTKFEEFWQRDVEESIRQLNMKPFIEEAVLQVSHWSFKLADLQVQKKCPGKGFLPWFKFIYSQEECELTGFLGPVHIWQGTDDQVVPPSMTDYVARVLPGAAVHKLPDEGHFSYFFFCDECHQQIFSTLFGKPKGPVESTDQPQLEADAEQLWPQTDS
ncbi:hypothetical protein LOK49_LG05G00636 [Camellia lanceoleosa]|uniref:Uncharacterized protein n=1 Tax=Camellia lanceoleosa TaxID=1840588 RepID=A0ACC0HVH6_9ERIC|nr:hypothetical protein LOK49_LG05G00636 [Camellia lanceoleosa]